MTESEAEARALELVATPPLQNWLSTKERATLQLAITAALLKAAEEGAREERAKRPVDLNGEANQPRGEGLTARRTAPREG